MKQQKMIGIAVGAVVLVGISFYAGVSYQKSQVPTRGQFGGNGTTGGINMRRTTNGFVSGSIIAKDDTSITVKMQDGSTKIVLVGASTQVMKSTSGSMSDLSEGVAVVVTGTPNSDGSIAAESVQIRPVGMPAMGGRRIQQ